MQTIDKWDVRDKHPEFAGKILFNTRKDEKESKWQTGETDWLFMQS